MVGCPVLMQVAAMLLGMEAAGAPAAAGGDMGLLPIPSHHAASSLAQPPGLAGKLLSSEAGLISLLNLPP